MKKITLVLAFCFCVSASADAQVIFIIKYIASKIIRAIDLKVQQLQNEAINLTVLQKHLENNFSLNSLSQIASWEQKQKDLYAGYFDELKSVKKSLAFTSRISEVMQKQKQVVTDTKRAMQLIYADTHFTATEAAQFNAVCESLLNGCVSNLSQMLQIVTAGQFTMSDGERLSGLIQTADEVEALETKLNGCLQKVRDLAIAREQDAAEIKNIKKLYGFK